MSTPARSCGRGFSPLGSREQVPARETQRLLREAFGGYGRPALLRADNGTPWGASGGLPTALELWLAGCGVATHHNDPRRPEQNGCVERSHGTVKRWAEPWLCASAEQLQRRADEASRRQRESYPYRKKASRMEAFPSLRHSGREHGPRWEADSWSLEAALAALAEAVEKRQVDQNGCVSLYSRNVSVGRPWRGSEVWVRYDPAGRRWTFYDSAGRLVQHRDAPEISHDSILDLTASDSRTKRKPIP
jgi:hypothetical protein